MNYMNSLRRLLALDAQVDGANQRRSCSTAAGRFPGFIHHVRRILPLPP